jgi:hypothetical protein
MRTSSSRPNQELDARTAAAVVAAASALQANADRRELDVRAQNSGSSKQDELRGSSGKLTDSQP